MKHLRGFDSQSFRAVYIRLKQDLSPGFIYAWRHAHYKLRDSKKVGCYFVMLVPSLTIKHKILLRGRP